MTKQVEKFILGSMILDKEAAKVMFTNYTEEYFQEGKSQKLYIRLKELNQAGQDIDATMIIDTGLQSELASYAVDCMQAVDSIILFPDYLDKLNMLKLKRDVRALAENLQEQVKGNYDITELLNNLSIKIEKLKPEEKKEKGKIYDDIIREYEDLKFKGQELESGIPYFDKITNGLKRKRTYILGGLPGSGKTGLALYLAHRISFIEKKKVLFFSLEMSLFEITGRLISIIEGVPNWKLQKPYKMCPDEWIKFSEGINKLIGSTLEIEDGYWTIPAILTKIKQFKPDLVVIDHLQYLPINTNKNEKEYNILNSYVKTLKDAAVKENFCLLLISQNRRNVAGYSNDDNIEFRGASGIKELADMAMIITKPNKKTTTRPDGFLRLNIVKNRYGRGGFVNLYFNTEKLIFAEYTDQEDK